MVATTAQHYVQQGQEPVHIQQGIQSTYLSSSIHITIDIAMQRCESSDPVHLIDLEYFQDVEQPWVSGISYQQVNVSGNGKGRRQIY